MGRFTRRMFEEDAREFSTDENYNIAYKKVKRIKGFYSHLKVYIIVNIIIVISSYNRDFIGGSGFWNWHTFSTALFWGIGLAIHGISVFGPDLFFNNDWEQKKIQKIMEKEKENKNKWE
ncbi:2TM domain-containing protein [Flavobacterium aquicola]|uniref:2TM domain-containing protein n=1 Tax=Flavobacterium aquicola TaxID=1682742 RepID=A0A3E0ESC9_9FLAO|nr:2TM domain-containing protein [Flavobacterium aquicola]REH01128.1 2TM domain-containing protein [Flavobacterium aquicola]